MTLDSLRGLDEAEAARRLIAAGPNALPAKARRGVLRIAGEPLREPMFLLLVGAAVLYLLLGDLGEGLFLVAGALASIGLVVAQESRSERALQALQALGQPLARVIRAGREGTIPARDLVPGDLLLIGEGDRVPADAWLIGGDVLAVDESTLTGESAAVSKPPADAGPPAGEDPEPGAQTGPWLFSGTLVVRGQGVARVTRTGAGSALGRIGASLAGIVRTPTPLQQAAGRLVGLLGGLALGFCLIVTLAYGLVRGDWISGILAGITLAIALIPEEVPMVLVVFLALGGWRLARRQVLARRGAVIETLGGATVLCVDKTGTLTENRMQVSRLWAAGTDTVIPGPMPAGDPAAALVRLAALASAVRPVDPMDRAVRALAADIRGGADGLGGDAPDRIWPLRPDRMAVIQAWPRPDGTGLAAAKGAPEAIFALCRLEAAAIAPLQAVVERYAAAGLRVLAVASAPVAAIAPADPAGLDFTLAGLVGFVDPLRPDVPAALAEARAAGIVVVMITGDHPATALATARAAGLDTTAGVLGGAEVAALSSGALAARLRTVRVCARIQPAQKLRIVEALKADGQVVAMTGDGVNDAPALEAAHISIAMGVKGTDVAREAADLVLLDDSFTSIVGGVRLGRRIFANLRRALIYITAIHVPIAGLALGPILFGLASLLFPMHVVLMELAIDPLCALVFEAEPDDAAAMRRPPRRRDEPLFGPAQLARAALQGLGVLIGVLGLYVWALGGWPEAMARGAAFAALVIGNLGLALADAAGSGRLFAPYRRAYWLIATIILVVLTGVFTVPAFAAGFGGARPDATLLVAALVTAVIAAGWMPLADRVKRWRFVDPDRSTGVERPPSV